MELINIKNLSMNYSGVSVLKNVSFTIESGDYLVIIGGNGSGKTTLMKGILGLKNVEEGFIEYTGIKKVQIGYLPQTTEISKGFPASVYEVVISGMLSNIGNRTFYNSDDKRLARESMDRLGIGHLAKKSFRELSGGQQQRVLLARALCGDRELLFLDEPVTGLDPEITEEFYSIIKALNDSGKTIVHISHDVDRVLNDANKVMKLKNEIEFYGSKEDWMNRNFKEN